LAHAPSFPARAVGGVRPGSYATNMCSSKPDLWRSPELPTARPQADPLTFSVHPLVAHKPSRLH
jgi:hypothetical protein